MGDFDFSKYGQPILVAVISAILGLAATTYDMARDATAGITHIRELFDTRCDETSRRLADLERRDAGFSDTEGHDLEVRVHELERHIRDHSH